MARDCPEKPQGPKRPIKAIEDRQIAAVNDAIGALVFNGFSIGDKVGYQKVGKAEAPIRASPLHGGILGFANSGV